MIFTKRAHEKRQKNPWATIKELLLQVEIGNIKTSREAENEL